MSTFEIIRDASALAKMGVELSNDIRNTDERIHQYLLSEIIHIEEHRNPTRLNMFLSRVKGSGARVNAMHSFVQVFGHVTLNEEANSAIARKDGKSIVKEIKGVKSKYGRTEDNGEVWAVWYSVVKGARKSYTIKEEGKDVKVTRDEFFEFAQSKPWYEFRPEGKVTPFDMKSKFTGLLKSAWSAQIGDKAEINKDFLAELTELAFKYNLVEKTADIISDVAKVPGEYKTVLHLSNDNAPVEQQADTNKPAKTRAATAA